jgi:hypothetical protein
MHGALNSGLSQGVWLGVGGRHDDGDFSRDLVKGLHLADTYRRMGGAAKRQPRDRNHPGCCDYRIRDRGRLHGRAAAYDSRCVVASTAVITIYLRHGFEIPGFRVAPGLRRGCPE